MSSRRTSSPPHLATMYRALNMPVTRRQPCSRFSFGIGRRASSFTEWLDLHNKSESVEEKAHQSIGDADTRTMGKLGGMPTIGGEWADALAVGNDNRVPIMAHGVGEGGSSVTRSSNGLSITAIKAGEGAAYSEWLSAAAIEAGEGDGAATKPTSRNSFEMGGGSRKSGGVCAAELRKRLSALANDARDGKELTRGRSHEFYTSVNETSDERSPTPRPIENSSPWSTGITGEEPTEGHRPPGLGWVGREQGEIRRRNGPFMEEHQRFWSPQGGEERIEYRRLVDDYPELKVTPSHIAKQYLVQRLDFPLARIGYLLRLGNQAPESPELTRQREYRRQLYAQPNNSPEEIMQLIKDFTVISQHREESYQLYHRVHEASRAYAQRVAYVDREVVKFRRWQRRNESRRGERSEDRLKRMRLGWMYGDSVNVYSQNTLLIAVLPPRLLHQIDHWQEAMLLPTGQPVVVWSGAVEHLPTLHQAPATEYHSTAADVGHMDYQRDADLPPYTAADYEPDYVDMRSFRNAGLLTAQQNNIFLYRVLRMNTDVIWGMESQDAIECSLLQASSPHAEG